MKRKPMLFDKVKEGRKNKTKESIGLVGAHRGAGVTYTGLLLAFYMGEEMGIKTAFLECNNHHDMEMMQTAYEWSREDKASFSFGNVTIFKDFALDRLPEVFSEEYECFILDFGTEFMANKDEFLRCGRKLILGGQGEWNRQKLVKFINVIRPLKGSGSWTILIPCAEPKVIGSLKSGTGRIFYAVPYESDPTMPSRETARLFDKLIC